MENSILYVEFEWLYGEMKRIDLLENKLKKHGSLVCPRAEEVLKFLEQEKDL
jgi:hypothetical protein